MSARTVALLETLPGEQADALRGTLPEDWTLTEGDELDGADYLVLRDGTADAETLAAAGNLRRVVHIEMGSGRLDGDACAARGVPVDVIRSPALMSVAEHAVTLILMLLKRVQRVSAELRAGEIAGGVEPAVTTQEEYAFNWTGLEHWEALYGKTIGLVGLGQIGTHAARLLNVFGADVVYTKRNRLAPAREAELGVRYASFDDLLRGSRCVSLHNRFDETTERMMGAREFALMPRGAFFVNTARGRLVDEAALVEALESGHLGGAALDVFWMEPLPPDSPLLRAPNLVLTPHTGGIPIAESRNLELQAAGRILAADG
ncbi:MAG TPA: NAD(P)-dependent oxidoreductase [Solirubrobacteraceae bacterium]|nr:NAD(P)-dependent oxidoreductase [Solirubrobacteraceae bacterium]